MTKRGRSGEYVVMGCLFSPGTLLLLSAVLLPADPRHGNALLVLIGLFLLAVAGGLMLLQVVLPKPREPEPPPPASGGAPDG